MTVDLDIKKKELQTLKGSRTALVAAILSVSNEFPYKDEVVTIQRDF